MKKYEVVKNAIKLLSKRGAWVQNALALDKQGNSVPTTDPAACKWCALGALMAGNGKTPITDIRSVVEAVVIEKFGGTHLTTYNDAPGRRNGEVIAVLKATYRKLKAKNR